MGQEDQPPGDRLRERVGAIPYWYHTLELAPGVVTPGHFDLRPVVDALPWPDVQGKRCLDVATFDGFYAFELEARGAAEVVAIDLDDAADLDWLPRRVPAGFRRGDEPTGQGFELARETFRSGVRRIVRSVYDLNPDELGTFDVVICGALLQHLRDPAGALLAIRSVCNGQLLSVEHVDAWRSLVNRRTPLMRLVGTARTWGLGNIAAHHRLLDMTGFDLVRCTRLGIPFGPGFRAKRTVQRRIHRVSRQAAWRALTGSDDPPFSAVLAQPALGLPRLP